MATPKKTAAGKKNADLKKKTPLKTTTRVPNKRKTPPGFGSNMGEEEPLQAWERGESVQLAAYEGE